MKLLYCPKCNNYLEGGDGENHDCSCGWSQPMDEPESFPDSPLGNSEWHHGNGVLCCGTLRIATADFDTNPSEEFREEMFDWIVAKLNS